MVGSHRDSDSDGYLPSETPTSSSYCSSNGFNECSNCEKIRQDLRKVEQKIDTILSKLDSKQLNEKSNNSKSIFIVLCVIIIMLFWYIYN